MKDSLQNKLTRIGTSIQTSSYNGLPKTDNGFDFSVSGSFMMEPPRKSSLQLKAPQKKTTFFLTSQEKGQREPSNDLKQAGEQDKIKGKFASVARTVLLANRAFPSAVGRKVGPGQNSGPIPNYQSELPLAKFTSCHSPAANSVVDNSSLYLGEKPMMENTYKMKPDNFFLTGKAGAIIRDVLEGHLRSKSFIAEESKRLSVEISEEIKRKVKAEAPVERYKFVCVVCIGQQLGQGVHITSRCLWNAHFDNYA